jgi:hypothetical protein
LSKKNKIKYVGKVPCKIPGTDTGLIKPGQTLSLPENMVVNLALDKNWERIGTAETPTLSLPETKKGKTEIKEEKKKGGK